MTPKYPRVDNWAMLKKWLAQNVVAVCFGSVSVLWLYLQLCVWKEEGHDHMLTAANISITVVLWSFLIYRTVYGSGERQSFRLKIHNADYRAMDGQGESYDVTDCLQKMIRGDALILQIENGSFQVKGKNYVPKDPFFGVMKRLDVTYSFDGVVSRVIRPENTRIVLPEDSFVATAVAAVPQIPFSRFQLEAFQLAKDILIFLSEMGKKPEPDRAQYGYDPSNGQVAVNTSNSDVHQFHDARRKLQQPWFLKCASVWQLKNFPSRIEQIIPQFGIEGLDASCLLHLKDNVTRGLFSSNDAFELAKNIIYLSHGLDTGKVVPLLDQKAE